MSDLVITALILGVVQILGIAGLILSLKLWADSKERQINSQIKQWITPPAEGQPPPIRAAAENLGQILGESVSKAMAARLLGGAGAVQRQLKGLESDMKGDLVEQQTPLAQGIFDLFPSVGKRARRSPVAAMILENIARRFAGGSGVGSTPTDHGKNPFDFQ